MAATLRGGPVTWSLAIERETRYRDYIIAHYVVTDDVGDGPYTAANCAGLPTIGSVWNFDNDYDPWAFCTPALKANIVAEKEGDPTKHWRIEQLFSTRPLSTGTDCSQQNFDNPLTEPQRVGGSFAKYQEEAQKDRHGKLIKSSSYEMLRGPQNEWDAGRPTVWIEQNVTGLGLATFSEFQDHVNSGPMWGLGPRCVKLDNTTWERKTYGMCFVYYTRRFDFSVNFKTFDRKLLDEGTKVLNGRWPTSEELGAGTPDVWMPDPGANYLDPSNFQRFKDRHGENARVILDGGGQPITTDQITDPPQTGGPGQIPVEKYEEANLFLLGVPAGF